MTTEDKAFLAGIMSAEAANIQLQKDLIAALREIQRRQRALGDHDPAIVAIGDIARTALAAARRLGVK
jgi:hypothetical protein